MRLLTMPSGVDACLLYSAAMVLDEKPHVLESEIGHDGQEHWWRLPGPSAKRGHHIQELQDCAIARGKGFVRVELFPRSAPEHMDQAWRLIFDQETAQRRFKNHVKGRRGILIGRGPYSDLGHACAWTGKDVYDPNGLSYPLENFVIKECWLLAEMI